MADEKKDKYTGVLELNRAAKGLAIDKNGNLILNGSHATNLAAEQAELKRILGLIQNFEEKYPHALLHIDQQDTLYFSLLVEIQNPKYKGATLDEIIKAGTEQDENENTAVIKGSLYEQALENAYNIADFIKTELEKPIYNNFTLTELQHIGGSLYDKLLTAVKSKFTLEQVPTADDAAELIKDAKLVTTRFKKPPHYQLTLDKIDKKLWNNLVEVDTNGQMRLLVDVTPTDNKLAQKTGELNEIVNLSFKDLPAELVKRLTPFDRRVHNAIGTLYNYGNKVMTLSQIYRQMGGKAAPAASQIQKINDSITKMMCAIIEIDSLQEATAYKNNTRYLSLRGAILPIVIASEKEIVNGRVTDFAIHVSSELPLYKIARAKGQLESIPLELLQSGLNMTDTNLAMQEYILDRITEMKRGRASSKVLYKSLYAAAGVKERTAQFRLRNALYKYLEELKEKDYIKNYKEDTTETTGETGVIIFL